jgi:hypothetical protein
MNVKEKGQSGIYTKVYGYIPKDAELKSYKTEKGSIDKVIFDVVYETGSIDKSTNKPQTKGIRCEVAPIKLGGSLPVAGTKIEVGGPLRVDYDKEGKKTYVSVRVAELRID